MELHLSVHSTALQCIRRNACCAVPKRKNVHIRTVAHINEHLFLQCIQLILFHYEIEIGTCEKV